MLELFVDQDYMQDVIDSGYQFWHDPKHRQYQVRIPDVPDELLEGLTQDELVEFFGFQTESIIHCVLS